MNKNSPLFFCAVGGSGMLPLAMIVRALGYQVRGSDRSFDQGRTPERFDFIAQQGIRLFPQDGSGVTPDVQKMVVSAAIEETVPDYQAALRHGVPIIKRAALLADLFNAAQTGIAVAGTSGKSTTTGLIGWILHQAKLSPTIVNGAIMKNFVTAEVPFAGACVGNPNLFVSEVDESDGSISLFTPAIAVLNNIALDHKSMEELRDLFGAFISRSGKAVLNLDNAETAALATAAPPDKVVTYSLSDPRANLMAHNIRHLPFGAQFDVMLHGSNAPIAVTLPMPGNHNVSNALAAMSAALLLGVDLGQAAEALALFQGIGRRMDLIGQTASGILVIDDFAHNPDKISATLRSLHQVPGRLLILFQPHGFGPLRLMRREFAQTFAHGLGAEDRLYLPDPLYLGGTVNREVTSEMLAADITALGATATFCSDREKAAAEIVAVAKPGDRIIIMGARDDTLTALAQNILNQLKSLAL